MAYTVPTRVPDSLRAGDTASWSRQLPDYPASAGWVLSYVLVKAGAQINITATASGSDHAVEVATGSTAAWAAGSYAYQERVSLSGKTYTVGTGNITILPSFAAATSGLDARSHAEKTLAALEAWIEARDIGVAEYEIAGRKLKTIPITDLLALRQKYKNEVRRESGKSSRIYMRF